MSDLGKDNPELTSLFRWAVLAGLLLWIAMAVASSAPTSPSDSQAAVILAVDAAKAVVEDKTATPSLTDNPNPQYARCPSTMYTPRFVEINYACHQEGEVGSFEQPCRPGFRYMVKENRGTISVTPQILPGGESITNCTKPPPPQCTSENPALESTNHAACEAQYCVGDKCTDVDVNAGDSLLSAENLNEGRANLLLDAENEVERDNLVAQMNISSSETDTLLGAFNEQKTERITANATQIKSIEDYLAIQGCISPTYLTDVAGCEAAGTGLQRLKAENTRLDTLVLNPDLLADARRLEPAPIPVPNPLPAADSPVDPGPSVDPTVPRPPTFSPPPQQGQQNPSQQGGFKEFLQGFLKSLFGGGEGTDAPPPGNQVPKPPGTCTPELLCASNTLYQRNTQCVDMPVQQCQYGCSSKSECAVAPKDGQCLGSPTKPNVSGCLNGTWQAKYTNECITDWQCVQGNATKPTAQLSCQPLLADAGMTLAITYACSTGTSVGSGFSTNGALSGAITTVLATPPAGANTAIFGLTCTNQGQTATASCSVQVAKPAIVLVANPKSVASGEKVTIGWVTSGMEECTISSVQQDDFTEKYVGKKNVNGVAETSPITEPTDILFSCTTVGGNVREVTTTILVI